MLGEQKSLDTLGTEPYTCVVSSHSKTIRRVNILMKPSRDRAQAMILSPTEEHPTDLFIFDSTMRGRVFCASFYPRACA